MCLERQEGFIIEGTDKSNLNAEGPVAAAAHAAARLCLRRGGSSWYRIKSFLVLFFN